MLSRRITDANRGEPGRHVLALDGVVVSRDNPRTGLCRDTLAARLLLSQRNRTIVRPLLLACGSPYDGRHMTATPKRPSGREESLEHPSCRNRCRARRRRAIRRPRRNPAAGPRRPRLLLRRRAVRGERRQASDGRPDVRGVHDARAGDSSLSYRHDPRHRPDRHQFHGHARWPARLGARLPGSRLPRLRHRSGGARQVRRRCKSTGRTCASR
jgi:hypothetical protein